MAKLTKQEILALAKDLSSKVRNNIQKIEEKHNQKLEKAFNKDIQKYIDLAELYQDTLNAIPDGMVEIIKSASTYAEREINTLQGDSSALLKRIKQQYMENNKIIFENKCHYLEEKMATRIIISQIDGDVMEQLNTIVEEFTK